MPSLANDILRMPFLGSKKSGKQGGKHRNHDNHGESNSRGRRQDYFSEESLLNGIKLYKRNGEIERVCMRDIIMTDHGVAKGFEPNKFKQFEFSDTIQQQPNKLYLIWQKRRDKMMQSYRTDHHDNMVDDGRITWQANVVLRQGTSLDKIIDFLLQVQGDLQVFTVSFSGGGGPAAAALLEDCWLPTLADELCSLIDEATLRLLKQVVVHVRCGWGEDDSWLELLDDCVARLSAMTSSSSRHHHNEKLNGTERVALSSLKLECDDDDHTKKGNAMSMGAPATGSGEPPVRRCQTSLAA